MDTGNCEPSIKMGIAGIEPAFQALETRVLPLYYIPMNNSGILFNSCLSNINI